MTKTRLMHSVGVAGVAALAPRFAGDGSRDRVPDGVVVWPELLDIAKDESVRRDTRARDLRALTATRPYHTS